MAWQVSLDGAANAASGLAFLALGLLVLRLAPRRRGNIAFAFFSGAWGLRTFGAYAAGMHDDQGWRLALEGLDAAGSVATMLGALLVGLWLPRPLRPSDARIVAVAAAAWLGSLGGYVAVGMAAPPAPASAALADVLGAWNPTLSVVTWQALFVGLAALYALHAGRGAGPERAQRMLLGAAFGLFLAIQAGSALVASHDFPATRTWAILALGQSAAVVLVAALWLRGAARAQGREARQARNVALVLLAVPILVAAGVEATGASRGGGWQYAAGRVLIVAMVAYAVVRHQVFGIDLKVRWTLKQSTVAAAFVGVFFVVSESASSFLATEGGLGTYLGIAAAGLLVFALAPLQRAAERVAGAAMPGARAPAEMSAGERADAYRRLAFSAWADGALSADERRLLNELRDHLRLTPEEAQRIEDGALQAASVGQGARGGGLA